MQDDTTKYPEFETHRLNADGLQKAAAIAGEFAGLLSKLTVLCIEGRELAIVRTKLEEACFFAKKAMALNLVNQDYTGG